jgi:translation initiation factor IF-2
MEGLLAPTFKEVFLGQAAVQTTFSVPKVGTVAGCRVTSGKITRNAIVKLFRDHKEVFKGSIGSLRRIKEDVREVANGYECGIKLENFNDIKANDIIEAYTLEKVIMTLEEASASVKQS